MFQILSCGSNGSCQLGIGENNDEDQNCLIPIRFENGESYISHKPKKIVCGGNHSLILFENGDLYASGDNTYGQCGIVQDSGSGIFKKILGNWLDVACGWEFSVLVNTNNQVFVCGRGTKGELGLGKSINQTQLTELFKVPSEKVIVDVKSCMNHTILQCNDELWGWGSCRKGQLGNVENAKVLYTPTQLQFEGVDNCEIIDYGLGREFTVIQTKDRLFKFGKLTIDLPQLSDSQIGTMWSSLHLLTNGTIKSFGNNSHGQLFPKNDTTTIEEMSIGSEHGLVLSKNIVYTWGWGEHGNCGIQTKQTQDKVTFDYLNVLYNGSNKVLLLGTGCATSWVVIEIN